MDENMQMIKDICLKETSQNPIKIVKKLMKIENIPIHGPVHHIIDGYAFLTAMHNAGVEFDFPKALSDNEYYKDNLKLTSLALGNIAEVGGPRCCKRNAYLSLKTAIKFVEETYGILLEDTDEKCEFSHLNQQCIKERCPFYHH